MKASNGKDFFPLALVSPPCSPTCPSNLSVTASANRLAA